MCGARKHASGALRRARRHAAVPRAAARPAEAGLKKPSDKPTLHRCRLRVRRAKPYPNPIPMQACRGASGGCAACGSWPSRRARTCRWRTCPAR